MRTIRRRGKRILITLKMKMLTRMLIISNKHANESKTKYRKNATETNNDNNAYEEHGKL